MTIPQHLIDKGVTAAESDLGKQPHDPYLSALEDDGRITIDGSVYLPPLVASVIEAVAADIWWEGANAVNEEGNLTQFNPYIKGRS